MPAHNVEAYVEEAIRSVLSQRGVSSELLVADDASTDVTWDRIRAYRDNPRLRFWRFRKRHGPGATRNYLMDRAQGVYLSFCDADDVMLPGHLRAMVRALNHDPGAGVVYTDRLIRNRSGKLHRSCRSRGPAETWDLFEGPISNGGTLVRRTLIRKLGGYRTDLPILEDYDLFWKLSEVTRFIYLRGKPLYFYRKRPGSLSSQSKRKHSLIQRGLLRGVILRRYGFRVPW